MRRALRVLPFTLFLGLLGLLAPGCTKTIRERDLFHPRQFNPIPDGIERRNVEIVAPDSTVLRGWYLSAPESRRSLLYFYGNGETVRDNLSRLYWLAKTFRLNILAMDYRGYGFSGGKPTLAGLLSDADLAYDTLMRDLGGGAGPVLAYGFSLGSVVALHLAAERNLDGLILHGAFTSIDDVMIAWHRYIPRPLRWFIRLRAEEGLRAHREPVELMRGVRTPLLLIQGEDDRMFPPDLARRLLENSPAAVKRWCLVPGAGHNTVSLSQPPVRDCLTAFLDLLPAGVESRVPTERAPTRR